MKQSGPIDDPATRGRTRLRPGYGAAGPALGWIPEGASMLFPLLRQSAGVIEPSDFRF